MNKKRIISIILAIVFFAGFLAFTYAVQHYDVQPVGPLNSEIGFATFNVACRDAIGQNEIMYELTQVIGYLAILICAGFGVIGAVQLFKNMSLRKVDPDLICMGIFYLLCIGAYVYFQIKPINYRPVLEDGALASSYPSSHTILSICVFFSVLVEIARKITNKSKALVETLACLAMISFTVAARFLSGMHWATDIIAAMILSVSLSCIFLAMLPKKKTKCGK